MRILASDLRDDKGYKQTNKKKNSFDQEKSDCKKRSGPDRHFCGNSYKSKVTGRCQANEKYVMRTFHIVEIRGVAMPVWFSLQGLTWI